MNFVPKGPIDNNIVWFQIMTWRQSGNKSSSEPVMAQVGDVYMRHSGSMS